MKKLKVAILGTGNIGTDLLVKITKSENLDCSLFAGRTINSAGMRRAKEMGVSITDRGIQEIIDNPNVCDVVVDCTSAQAHIEHWRILKELGKAVVDMTPAKLGKTCVPALATGNWGNDEVVNINMITCGGQTTVPIAAALARVHKDIEYVEVASSIASLSAGPATRQNLDEYVNTTEEALRKFSGAKRSKAILILNPASPPIDMDTTIYAKIKNPDLARITASVNNMVETIREYVPGYQLLVPPIVKDDTVIVTVKVLGAGDFLPQYAGNLDIINCAAIKVLELMAQSRKK
jgi:acetaldehyde dehydrogenase (acetylating)